MGQTARARIAEAAPIAPDGARNVPKDQVANARCVGADNLVEGVGVLHQRRSVIVIVNQTRKWGLSGS